jgi:succinate dehydrogenase / fumarate reductase cytochrome b subunit
MIQPSRRPVFLDLSKIAMPVGALTSIGHRISGVVLAASAPGAVYVLGLSLHDASGWAQVAALFGQPLFKAVVAITAWALAHHMLDGVRHILTDFGVGASLRVARRSAWFVNLGGLVLALGVAGALL